MGVFEDLAANRRDKANASKKFVVRSLTKAGTVSKAKLTRYDLQFRATETREQAEEIAIRLAVLNPGVRYVVTDL